MVEHGDVLDFHTPADVLRRFPDYRSNVGALVGEPRVIHFREAALEDIRIELRDRIRVHG